MSQPDFYAILDDCLARQRLGEAPEACLAEYPEQAAGLEPALALSAELLRLPPLESAPEVIAHGYEAMMSAATPRERPSWPAAVGVLAGNLLASLKAGEAGRLPFALRAAMLLLVVIFASAAFAITASAGSLPGDRLYPVKRSWESTRLALTLGEPARQALESDFAQQRREEVQAVLELRRPVIVEFKGRLQSTGDDAWLVDGLSVAVGDDTVVSGVIIVGRDIFVRAQAQVDGLLLALEILGDEDGSADTAVPGDEPLPTGRPQPTSGPEPTDEPARTTEPTERPTRRPTREPTATPAPTREATATLVPATHTPQPNDALTDSVTATPNDRPTATPTDKPTNDTRPPDEPGDDTKATPEPTATQRPALEPTATDKPTREPTATHETKLTATKENDSAEGGSDRPS